MPDSTLPTLPTNAPLVLCILDGWGIAPPSDHNAIHLAHTPNWDKLVASSPMGELSTSGLDVGLPEGQMGNSEVGHMTIGSGRVFLQNLPKIDSAIADGSLKAHPLLQAALNQAKQTGKRIHLLGLLSDGGVHSHQHHILSLAKIIDQAGVVCELHAFLDGRDTPPASAEGYLNETLAALNGLPHARLATLAGRYYAMDRDKRWDRVEKAYRAITEASAPRVTDALTALKASYADGKQDEFLLPVALGDYQGMQEGDILLFANFRADRVRQLAEALLDPAFTGFTANPPRFDKVLGMVEYSEKLSRFVETLYPPEQPVDTLGEVVSRAGLNQLRIAETEKYAHVTFFFNGGQEALYPGEERILIPSPQVATYDLKPEMSAPEVAEKLSAAIISRRFALLVVNFANTDMVGHTGDIEAAKKAVEAVDRCLGQIMQAVEQSGGTLCITADHGNAEMMEDHSTGQSHTAHTTLPVPFLIAGSGAKGLPNALPSGRLSDIAPTVLHLLGLPIPKAMTGRIITERKVAA